MTSSAAERAAPGGIVLTGRDTPVTSPAVVGLRERKKARTRVRIRAEAIRLMSEQGFGATTVEQVAEAADISPSTFFRYFPTKEAVIITDEYDPLIFQEFRDQPADLHPLRAFRNAVQTVYGQVNQAAAEQEVLRYQLLLTVPELRSAMLDEFGVSIGVLAEMIGERTGKSAQDRRVRALAGAIIGVVFSVMLPVGPEMSLLAVSSNQLGSVEAPPEWAGDALAILQEHAGRVDAVLELLELGLPL